MEEGRLSGIGPRRQSASLPFTAAAAASRDFFVKLRDDGKLFCFRRFHVCVRTDGTNEKFIPKVLFSMRDRDRRCLALAC